MEFLPRFINWRFALALLSILYCAVMLRTAWVADDAMITLRSVQNFIHGYGPVFHVNERVQSFTHVSWFFLVAAMTLVIGSPYLGIIASGFLVNLATLGVLVRQFGKGTFYLLCALLLSKAFMDFANSGLENPLTFLLLALLIPLASAKDTPRKWMLAGLYCGLLTLTRPDLGLMLVAVAAAFFRRPGFAWIAVGLLPLFAWEAFSLFYYGSLVPNTALAKLNTSLPRTELVIQGIVYLAYSTAFDPLTILAIGFFLFLSFHRKSLRFVAGFVLSYVAYTIWIGGDFMAGRFFTAPFFASVLGLALLLRERHLPLIWVRRAAWAMVLAGMPALYLNLAFAAYSIHIGGDFAGGAFFVPALLTSLIGIVLLLRGRPLPRPWARRTAYGAIAAGLPAACLTALVGVAYDIHMVSGIEDERGHYFDRGYALANGQMFARFPKMPEWRLAGNYPSEVVTRITCGRLGTSSLRGGPNMHFVDICGLSDPLLARMPAPHKGWMDWRVGHLKRGIPTGYVESLMDRNATIAPPSIAALHKDLRIALSAPLLNPARLDAIWRLHTKNYGINPPIAATTTAATPAIMRNALANCSWHWPEFWEQAKENDVKRCIVDGVGANALDIRYGKTPLHWAAEHGTAEAVRMLIASGAEIEAIDDRGRRPLNRAAAHGTEETVRALINGGAIIDSRTYKDRTPLHAAAHYGNAETARMLIHAGADIEARTRFASTPLHEAAEDGTAEVVRELLDAGANIKVKTLLGQSPADLAKRNDAVRNSPEYQELIDGSR